MAFGIPTVASVGVDVVPSLSRGFTGTLSRALGGVFRGLRLPAIGAAAAGIGVLGAGLASATSKARDFESSIAQIEGLVGITGDALDELADGALALSGEVAKSPQELADALFFITSAGLEGAVALDTLEAAAKASAAGLGDTSTIADALTSAINAYGAENLSATEATDVLVAAIREGKLEASDLAGSLGKVIPSASQLGISFDQVGAALAAFSRIGIQAAEGTTALQAVMTTLIKPTSQAEEALDSVGLSAAGLREQLATGQTDLLGILNQVNDAFGGNTEAIAQVFPNVRALTGVFAVLGENGDQARAIFDELSDATGSLEGAFGAASETVDFQFAQAQERLNAVLTEQGRRLLPLAARGAQLLANVVERLAPIFERVVTFVLDAAEALEGGFGGAIEFVRDLLGGFGELVGDAIGGIGDAFSNLDIAGPLSGVFGDSIAGAVEGGVDRARDLVGGIFDNFGRSSEGRSAENELSRAVSAIIDGAFETGSEGGQQFLSDLLGVTPAEVEGFRGGGAEAAQAFVEGMVDEGTLEQFLELVEGDSERIPTLFGQAGADAIDGLRDSLQAGAGAVTGEADALAGAVDEIFAVAFAGGGDEALQGRLAGLIGSDVGELQGLFDLGSEGRDLFIAGLNAEGTVDEFAVLTNLSDSVKTTFDAIREQAQQLFAFDTAGIESASAAVGAVVFEPTLDGGAITDQLASVTQAAAANISTVDISEAFNADGVTGALREAQAQAETALGTIRDEAGGSETSLSNVGQSLVGITAGLGSAAFAVGPLSSGVAGIAGAFGRLGGILPLLTNPVGLIAAGIGALIALSPEFREALGGVFEQLAPVIGELASVVFPVLLEVVGALAPLFATLGELIGSLLSAVTPLIAALIGALAPVLETVLNLLRPLIGVATAVVDVLGFVLTPIIDVLGVALAGLVQLFTPLLDFFATITEDAEGLVTALGGLIGGIVSGVSGPLRRFVRIVVAPFRNLFDLITAPFRAAVEFFTTLFSGGDIGDAIDAAIGSIVDTVAGIIDRIADVLGPIGDVITAPFQAAIEFVRGLFGFGSDDTLGGSVQSGIEGIATFLGSVADVIFGPWRVLWALITEGPAEAFETLKSLISDRIGGIVETLGGIASFFTGVWNTIWSTLIEPVADAATTVVGAITGFVDTIGGFFSDASETVTGFWSELWGGFETIMQPVIDIVEGIISGFIALFTGDFEGVKDAVLGIWGTLWDSLPSPVRTAVGILGDILGGLLDTVNTVVSGVVSGVQKIKDAWESIAGGGPSKAIDDFAGQTRKLDPGQRFSPSLVERVQAGVQTIKDEYSSLSSVTIDAPTVPVPTFVADVTAGIETQFGTAVGRVSQIIDSLSNLQVEPPEIRFNVGQIAEEVGRAVALADDRLEDIARIAGTTAEQFASAFTNDPITAMQQLLDQIGDGEGALDGFARSVLGLGDIAENAGLDALQQKTLQAVASIGNLGDGLFRLSRPGSGVTLIGDELSVAQAAAQDLAGVVEGIDFSQVGQTIQDLQDQALADTGEPATTTTGVDSGSAPVVEAIDNLSATIADQDASQNVFNGVTEETVGSVLTELERQAFLRRII